MKGDLRKGGLMKKIYIIDDDRDIVESISMVLKANGLRFLRNIMMKMSLKMYHSTIRT